MPDDIHTAETRGALKTRTYAYSTATLDPESALAMTGLDYMRALASGRIGAKPSMAETVGMSPPLDLEFGKCAVEAEPGDYLMNPMGGTHGGFAATLLDSAMGIAVHTALPAATAYTTAELKINYTRAITPTTGRLRAEGSVIHIGRQMATAEARLVGLADGKLYAHGSTTCFLFPLQRRAG
jgi:uncharacterized protein (TIGR00369 family)